MTYNDVHIHRYIKPSRRLKYQQQLLPWTGTGEELAVEQIVLPVIQLKCQKYQ